MAGAEAAALVRLGGGPALPALGVLADGAVIPAQVKVAGAAQAGKGGLSLLDTGAALIIDKCHVKMNKKDGSTNP